MDSNHQLIAILGIIVSFFSYLGFSKYMENKKIEIETKSREVLKQLDIESQANYMETINKSIEALKEVSINTNIQKAINQSKH